MQIPGGPVLQAQGTPPRPPLALLPQQPARPPEAPAQPPPLAAEAPDPPNPPRQQHRANSARDSDSDALGAQEDFDDAVGNGRAPNPCKVSKFKESSKGETIEIWFYQMENYMELNGIGHQHWIKTCISNFNSPHFDPVRGQREFALQRISEKSHRDLQETRYDAVQDQRALDRTALRR